MIEPVIATVKGDGNCGVYTLLLSTAKIMYSELKELYEDETAVLNHRQTIVAAAKKAHSTPELQSIPLSEEENNDQFFVRMACYNEWLDESIMSGYAASMKYGMYIVRVQQDRQFGIWKLAEPPTGGQTIVIVATGAHYEPVENKASKSIKKFLWKTDELKLLESSMLEDDSRFSRQLKQIRHIMSAPTFESTGHTCTPAEIPRYTFFNPSPDGSSAVFDNADVYSLMQVYGAVILTPHQDDDIRPAIDFKQLEPAKSSSQSIPFTQVNLATSSSTTVSNAVIVSIADALKLLVAGTTMGQTLQFDSDVLPLRNEEEKKDKAMTSPFYFPNAHQHEKSLDTSESDLFEQVIYVQQHHCNMRRQPMNAPFVHHVLKGSMHWYAVASEYRTKLDAVLAKYIKLYLSAQPQFAKVKLTEQFDQLLLVLLHSGNLFPLPQVLRRRGIPVLEFDLKAGEVLYSKGDYTYWSLNQDASTKSTTLNVLPEEWLQCGPQYVCDYLAWLQHVRDHMKDAKKPHASLFKAILSSENLSACLHQVPGAWACERFSLWIKEIDENKRTFTLSAEVLKVAADKLRCARDRLHDLRKFYVNHKQEVCKCVVPVSEEN